MLLVVASALTLAKTTGAREQGSPLRPLPDIDVLYISRTPRFPAYRPDYDLPGRKGVPTLVDLGTRRPLSEEEIRAVQRWPKQGEEVTFTAHVQNRGDADAAAWDYTWWIDGKKIAAGKVEKPQKPGDEITAQLKWSWKPGRHTVQFVADPLFKVRDRYLQNNTRSDATDAWALAWAVDRKLYEQFNRAANMVGTRSFEDWAQWHIDQMNRLFDASPLPKGMVDKGWRPRIRCDAIYIVDKTEGWEDAALGKGKTALDVGFDGAWPFAYREQITEWASEADWGLIHEWGHQLGLTDEYALDRPGYLNEIADGAGRPLLTGRMSSQQGHMMHGHGPTTFSPVCMAALVLQKGVRRGFYGDYYYCTPDICAIRILDRAGKPVPGAKVTAWQDRDSRYAGKPVFTVTSGTDGVAVLPNRPAPYTSTPPGFTHRDNPFGQINVVGSGDVLQLQISSRGHTETTWLDIAEVNMAWFEGKTQTAVLNRQTRIPSKGALPAPRSISVRSEGDRAFVSWAAVPKATKYRVFHCANDKGQWKLAAETTKVSCELTLTNDLFHRVAVTAVGSNSATESAMSREARAFALKRPWGITITDKGQRIVRDAAHGQFLVYDAKGEAIGPLGSVHDHLEGSYDVATGPEGRVYCAKWGDGYDANQGIKVFSADFALEKAYVRPPGTNPGEVKGPMGIGVNSQGHIFLADTGNDRIQEFGPDGKFIQVIGLGEVRVPTKIVFDKQDRMFVADSGRNRVAQYEKQDTGVYKLTKEYKDGKRIKEPVYVAVDDRGRVFVSTNRVAGVYMFNPDGTLAWNYEPPTGDTLNCPRGLALDGKGHLLVVDEATRSVRQLTLPN
jgi:hypothetical protein